LLELFQSVDQLCSGELSLARVVEENLQGTANGVSQLVLLVLSLHFGKDGDELGGV
jgi:hypothetical protein